MKTAARPEFNVPSVGHLVASPEIVASTASQKRLYVLSKICDNIF